MKPIVLLIIFSIFQSVFGDPVICPIDLAIISFSMPSKMPLLFNAFSILISTIESFHQVLPLNHFQSEFWLTIPDSWHQAQLSSLFKFGSSLPTPGSLPKVELSSLFKFGS